MANSFSQRKWIDQQLQILKLNSLKKKNTVFHSGTIITSPSSGKRDDKWNEENETGDETE